MFGTLEGVYCPADKETCTQSELKKVFALHSSAHDKALGEIGDVPARPSDPTNKNYFGYPRNVIVDDLNANMHELSKVPFIERMVNASVKRMEMRSWVVPVKWENFDLMLWQDLKGRKNEIQWVPPKFDESLADEWRDAATMKDTDAKAIYQVLAGADPNDLNVYNAETVTEDLLGPACSSLTNVWGETNDAELFTNAKDETARGVFNPLFSSNCVQPTFPSPQPGFLAHNLTQGARTYSTSGPFMYLSKYAPQDFFDRGNRANPNLPWVPGTLLTDIALGGLPFRNLFPTDQGGTYGYSNKEILELSMPCTPGRAPNNRDKPCSPYYYSKGE